MDKKIVISCGPIPAKLDSVKYITNRFKGGLAFKTASKLFNKGYDVTVVKWKYTDIPRGFKANSIVDVEDVGEYYSWMESNARNYDAFILAAAVANLEPSKVYEGKFPSHHYKEGEEFYITFKIAPRAIDVIKRKNPTCCLIGYKLFDASTDEELIDAATTVLKSSKANVIFANRPSDAKSRKLALTQDGAVIEMDFDAHIEFIEKAINSRYFKTYTNDQICKDARSGIAVAMPEYKGIKTYIKLVELFENSFSEHGCFAIKTPYGIVTTNRGHNNEVPKYSVILDIDFNERTIWATTKATLNAPLLWNMLKDKPIGTYVVHRHFYDKYTNPDYANWNWAEYQFAGTYEEAELSKLGDKFYIKGHGYLETKQILPVDWHKYYEVFPSRYFNNVTSKMAKYIDKYCGRDKDKYESLEIGGNTTWICKYNLDINMPKSDDNLTYDMLSNMEGKFDFILIRNSIAYLTNDELEIVKKALKPGGKLIANCFAGVSRYKLKDTELAVLEDDDTTITHYLWCSDTIYTNQFYYRTLKEYTKLGFKVSTYGKNSMMIEI